MIEETEETTTETEEAKTTETEEQSVPYERFQQVNRKAKDNADRAKSLEKDVADLRSQMEERESAGLPELDRERKRAEQLEKRIADAEKRAEDAEQGVARARRERLVIAAASTLNFANPSRAHRLVDGLDDIDDSDAAEKAVKRLAKSDPYLVKTESTQPQIGRVLTDGKTVDRSAERNAAGVLKSDAEAVSEGLREFLASKG